MIVLQPTAPNNDLHSFTAATRSLNQPNASIAVGPQPVQQSMYQAAAYPAHTTFVYSPATNSVTQQAHPSPRSSVSQPVRHLSSDNIPLESAPYSLQSNSSSYRYDSNQMAGVQESRSQAQPSSAVIASEGVGQNYGATSDPRASVGVSSSPQQASLGSDRLPPLSEVLQQPPPSQQQPQQQRQQQQQQQQPQAQEQGQHQQHQQHQQPQQQVQNQQQQPQQQQPQQSQTHQLQSGSSSPATSPTQPHHASSGSLMPPTAAAAAAGFYPMSPYTDVSPYASQDGTYAAQASLIPPTQQQQAAMVQQSMNQLGQQTSQLVTVVDPRLPPIAAQGSDLQAANLSASLIDPSGRRLAISTANMAMNPSESTGSSTASPIMPPSATNALNNYQHLLNTPFMTAAHPVMMAPPRSLHGRRDVADASMQAMVERPQQKVYSFVPLPGINTKKRPRRRYDEIERHYACNWPGCSKAYGTLNHLNAHVQMQKHGAKRHPSEFKELRKMWRRQKREEEERKAAEAAAVKQNSVATVNINGIAGLHSV